ncbi:frizzled-4-like [Cylas formicarius]|uniref:frizzled-4-like n=1 Tax=Cylas formicarius TaxID=197179 RepID=UPI002958A451|nr:frizzled-4-like [Cylas formicarius]
MRAGAMFLASLAIRALLFGGTLVASEPMFRTCEPIRVKMCSDLGYNMTGMPNLGGNDIQQEADYNLQTFSPLIQYGCSRHLKLFLCSVYVPMCTEKVANPIGPCRGLCENVRSRCYPVLQEFGFPWADALNCSRFPVENNHDHMCMEGPKDKIDIRAPVDPAVSKFDCGSRGSKPTGGCVRACDQGGGVFDDTEKRIAEVWITVWALACLASSLGAALTLTLGGGKIRALPLAILSLCYFLVGAGWTLRSFAGRAGVHCVDDATPSSEDGLRNVNCAFIFLLLYYFGMAANAWWVCLCAWWLARAGLSWTPDKMRSLASFLHVCGWGFPAVQTVAALVHRDVDSDELTGTCYVGNKNLTTLLYLVLMPYFFYFFVGVVLLAIGWTLILYKPKNGGGTASAPLTQTAPRKERDFLGALCALYAIPTFCVIASYHYEYSNREDWLSGVKKPVLWALLLRHFMSLFVGISSIFWIWSAKSAQAWKSALRRLGPRKRPSKPAQVLCYPLAHAQPPRQPCRPVHAHRKVPRCHHLRSGSETII